MWRLRQLRDGAADAAAPSVIVSPVRALLQRLGPHVEDTEPLQVVKGAELDLDDLVERLAHIGYRREYEVEHRGEMAVRGSIVDVFPSTALSPVRIDLWGDEVDRLTRVLHRRPAFRGRPGRGRHFRVPRTSAFSRGPRTSGSLGDSEPWGSEAWERLAEGLSFDGMESWLPWLSGDEHLLIDLLPRGAKVLLVEPRRMRERAVEIAEEEADLAGALAVDVGGRGPDFPRLYLPFDRLLSGTDASVAMLAPAREGPGTPTISTMGWDPVAGGPERLLAQLRELTAKRYTVVVCAENEGTPPGWPAPCKTRARRNRSRPAAGAACSAAVPAAVRVVVAPIDRGFIFPALQLAVLAEGDLTGRRRPHRSARPRAAQVATFFDDMKTGDYVVHFQHGVARFGGMVNADRRRRTGLFIAGIP